MELMVKIDYSKGLLLTDICEEDLPKLLRVLRAARLANCKQTFDGEFTEVKMLETLPTIYVMHDDITYAEPEVSKAKEITMHQGRVKQLEESLAYAKSRLEHAESADR